MSRARKNPMIPKIIHQTWKNDDVPAQFRDFQRSWTDKNPGWTYMFWSDRALMDFVAEHYPELLHTYCGYEHGIRRSDAARYMLLDHFGGFYADLDAECIAPLDPLADDDRLILSEEPHFHWQMQLRPRSSIDRLLFNGVMASPAKHPFWRRMLKMLPETRDCFDTLDATGPCLLSAMVQSDPEPGRIAIYPSALFNAQDYRGQVQDSGQSKTVAYALHHWAGTWYSKPRDPTWISQGRKRFHRLRHKLTRGKYLVPEEEMARIDKSIVNRPAPVGDGLAILAPVRDCADHIAPFLAAVGKLDFPKEKIKLVFCEGDSNDDSYELLRTLIQPLRSQYREIRVLQKHVDTKIPREGRWKNRWQRTRRAGIAQVRNHLIHHGLDESDDWALWIDIDVWKFPKDIVSLLRASGERVVVPNTRTEPAGKSFDLNSFVQQRVPRDYRYWRSMKHGLYMPKAGEWGRLHLSDLCYLDRVELDGVGGTMLLVDANLHRAGLNFPELPYRNLIETEGFAAMARDLGITPIGLPKVEVLHVPW